MTRPIRSALGAPLVVAALAAVGLAGPGVAPAAAKARHTPCPTTGTTILKAPSPNLRVWHEGATLRACTRVPGKRRYLRTLGTWSAATQVAAGAGDVAWSTRRSTPAGPVDDLRTTDVRTGASWLKTTTAAVAPDAATPASADRVLRLVTDDTATAWVTARGVVGATVRKLDADQPGTLYGDGLPGTTPYRSGRTFFLGDAGPAAAPAVAAGLALDQTSEGDECGGTTDHRVKIPAFGTRPATVFSYLFQDYTSPYDYCH
jgi:hypothetical protein